MDKKRHILQAATVYLEMRGYKIIELNWRQARQKIDIICQRNSVMLFVSITYLKDLLNAQDTIFSTTDMSLNLKEAVDAWSEENKYTGNVQLAELVIYGNKYDILNFYDITTT